LISLSISFGSKYNSHYSIFGSKNHLDTKEAQDYDRALE